MRFPAGVAAASIGAGGKERGAMSDARGETGMLWWSGVFAAGLIMFAYAYGTRPIAREKLVEVEVEAPLAVRREAIETGRHGGYFIQRFDVVLPDTARPVTVSSVRDLLIPEIEGLTRGTIRLAIDPLARQVYEAAVNGRSLLDYETTVKQKRRANLISLLAGVLCVGIGAMGLSPLWWPRDKTAKPSPE